MNVLYVNGDHYTLLTPKGPLEGLWADFRQQVQRAGVRGQVNLVTNGELSSISPLPEMSAADREPFLDSKMQGFTVARAQQATLVSVHDRDLVQSMLSVTRSAGLKPHLFIPLSTCALLHSGVEGNCVIIQIFPDAFESTMLSESNLVTRRTPKSDRLDLAKIYDISTKQLTLTGQRFNVVLVGAQEMSFDGLPEGVLTFGVQDVLRAALHPGEHPAITTPEHLNDSQKLTAELTGLRRQVSVKRSVDKVLLGTLGAAALLNAGLYLPAQITAGQNHALRAQISQLTVEAETFRALDAENTRLAQQVSQAKTISEDKGPLANDLPLMVSRVRTVNGTIKDLSGPNQPSETDVRSFGATVERTYDLNVNAPSAEELTRAYQTAGLLADIRSVNCKDECEISLRVAPAKKPADTTAAGGLTVPDTTGITTPGVTVNPANAAPPGAVVTASAAGRTP